MSHPELEVTGVEGSQEVFEAPRFLKYLDSLIPPADSKWGKRLQQMAEAEEAAAREQQYQPDVEAGGGDAVRDGGIGPLASVDDSLAPPSLANLPSEVLEDVMPQDGIGPQPSTDTVKTVKSLTSIARAMQASGKMRIHTADSPSVRGQ